MTGNDFSTECLYRIHSLLLELIEYSCNMELGKQSVLPSFSKESDSASLQMQAGNSIIRQWISICSMFQIKVLLSALFAHRLVYTAFPTEES